MLYYTVIARSSQKERLIMTAQIQALTTRRNKCIRDRIHFTFLIDEENHLIPCDISAHNFLKTIDADMLGEQILKLKFNSAMIMSTVILNKTS